MIFVFIIIECIVMEMSLSEKLFFKDIHETIENQVDYKIELLEKDDDGL